MTPSLSDEQRQILAETIDDFDDRLVTQSINISGQAFGNAFKLGCGVLVVPLLIVLGISVVRRTLDFSTVFVYSCAATMMATAFASFISSRAKQIAIKDNYIDDINPEIVHFLSANNFTRRQFDKMADEILGDEAPLREYLIKPSNTTTGNENE
ncbi:MAG: hypothetical protein ACE5GO_05625 [Anaerolineales bacterium]